MPHHYYRPLLFSIALLACVLAVPHPAMATDMPTCKTTVATYNGNLGGISGADAKCAAEYPGYRFARSSKAVSAAYANSDAANSGWVAMTYYCPAGSLNCTNWTGTHPSYSGSWTRTTPVDNSSCERQSCDVARAIWCCNF